MGAAEYDSFGVRYAEHSLASAFNALYDRPAMLELAGDVTGLQVLDVGCAAGLLSAALAERGAEVLGVDVSEVMIAEAERRHGGTARFRRADLTEPLDFLADDSVDLVTASLVLHYLRDWGPTLRELHRILRPGGAMVLSVHHSEDWHWQDRPDYFVTELLEETWSIGGVPTVVRYYRRPLSATFNALRDAGFAVDRLVEPMPVPEAAEVDPEAYAQLSTEPRFLYFRALPE
jgi:SAM-dependent methyltransferase